MPGKAEYGFLRGLGEGLTDVAKLGISAELQRMRDERLARIAKEAAAGKFAQDKKLTQLRVDSEVAGKKQLSKFYVRQGYSADGSAPEQYRPKWKPITDDMGNTSGMIDENSGKAFDLTTPEGRAGWANYQLALGGNLAPAAPPGGGGNAAPAAPPGRGGNAATNVSPSFADGVGGLLAAAKAMNPVYRFLNGPDKEGGAAQVDPDIEAIQRRLNNPDPTQRGISNTERAGYLTR